MTEKETDQDDKTERVLFLWDRLSQGGSVSRQRKWWKPLVSICGPPADIWQKSGNIWRKGRADHVHRELYYDRAGKVLPHPGTGVIRPSELYAIGKSFLPAGPFIKELESLLRRLLQSAVLGTDKKVERYIRGELLSYGPGHEKPDIGEPVKDRSPGAVKRNTMSFLSITGGREKEARPHEICPEGPFLRSTISTW